MQTIEFIKLFIEKKKLIKNNVFNRISMIFNVIYARAEDFDFTTFSSIRHIQSIYCEPNGMKSFNKCDGMCRLKMSSLLLICLHSY